MLINLIQLLNLLYHHYVYYGR